MLSFLHHHLQAHTYQSFQNLQLRADQSWSALTSIFWEASSGLDLPPWQWQAAPVGRFADDQDGNGSGTFRAVSMHVVYRRAARKCSYFSYQAR